jgi:hypothetical protein
MAGLSQPQATAIQQWLTNKKYECPICGAEPKDMRLNGTFRVGFLPWPDGSNAGGGGTMAQVECLKCACVILVDCDGANVPYYK